MPYLVAKQVTIHSFIGGKHSEILSEKAGVNLHHCLIRHTTDLRLARIRTERERQREGEKC